MTKMFERNARHHLARRFGARALSLGLRMQTSSLPLVPLAIALLCACSPRVTVVKPTNRIHTDTKFLVEPLHFEGSKIDGVPEAQWLAGKPEDQRKLWEESRAGMIAAYAERVHGDAALRVVDEGPLGPNTFALRANVETIEAGFFQGVGVVKETEVRLDVQIVDDQGAIVHEFRLRSVVPAGATNPSIGGRVRSAATDLAANTAKYLTSHAN